MKAVILNSRQHLYPTLSEAWVRQSLEAVQFVRDHGHTLLCSNGQPAWEMVCVMAQLLACPMIHYLPLSGRRDPGSEEEALVNSLLKENSAIPRILLAPLGEADRTNKSVYTLRDSRIIDDADLIIPVSIRCGGRLEALICEAEAAGKIVDRRFQCDYDTRARDIAYSVNADQLEPVAHEINNEYLIHWTRTTNGPWPGESLFAYYSGLVSNTRYTHTAFDTLVRILSEGCLLASRRHMPKDIATVSFSSLPPRKAVTLMRWRQRYREMSFEPYGIAIPKEVGLRHGIVPVAYYSGKLPRGISASDRWRWQSKGRIGDWLAEHEHRHYGDLHLLDVGIEDLTIFARSASEAAGIERRFGCRTIPLLHEELPHTESTSRAASSFQPRSLRI